jgi:uncharacterized membrane protein
MSESKDSADSVRPAPVSALAWMNWARVLLVIAMAAAGHLAWVSIHDGPAAGCGAGSGCNAVLQSRWAYWLGVPVSVPALLVYVSLFGCTFLLGPKSSPDEQRGSWTAIIVLSVVIAGSAFWFVSLQVFVIQSFCKYCLTAHACGCAAALIFLWNIPYASEPDTPMWQSSPRRGVPRRAAAWLVLMGLFGVAALAVGQVLVQKQRNVVTVVTAAATNRVSSSAGTASDIASAMASPNAHLIAPRTLSLYSNQFVINLGEVPMLGSPDAPHVIVCLLDYTCTHCRALHPILEQVGQQYSNQLGIVCLPVSLSAECNPFITKMNLHASPDSCELARLGLAVWRARPEAYPKFENWMFDGPKPPEVSEAREFAAGILGQDGLKLALANPWVSRQLLIDCKIHRANWLAADSSAMPQIVMGDAVSSGPLNSVGHLQMLLNRYMALTLR